MVELLPTAFMEVCSAMIMSCHNNYGLPLLVEDNTIVVNVGLGNKIKRLEVIT